MQIKCLSGIFIGLYVVAATSAVAAPASVREAMVSQLQLLALLPEQHALQQYVGPLRQSPQSASTITYQAQQALQRFWQQHGVDITNSQQLADDNFFRVSTKVSALLRLADTAPWPQLEPGGWLRPGDSHRLIPLIAERLYLLGDMPLASDADYAYSASIAEAVRHFQARHGLKVDAVIGQQTLYWLNVSPLQRAKQLAREYVAETSVRFNLPAQYILVNVPAYELSLVDQQQLVMQSKVIVGLPYRQTPMLQSEISSIVLNPSWHVPRSIVRRNLLAHIRADADYLQHQAFEAYDYQGQKVALTEVNAAADIDGHFPYRLIQKPGEHNALGRYKFHFSNSYDVYLHDTPEKSLFAKSKRALSSGCVRVEKAAQLAEWLAQHAIVDQSKWQQMQNDFNTTQWFKLKQKLPVYIVYWTAWVNNQGVAQFRPDIYHKQKRQISGEYTN
ncbi:L,D-transpeptidase family protein [Shewanella mangrovi]|uniref:L,D-transpeptidase family protein n=1 Tax=Shewanella mangrovi TaxID=1515746 RepID=UPI00068E4576|nr:L,D-transpeptidase family protein [Shewanella mangrovi]